MNKVAASVIVLAWNGSSYLPACLDALQAQEFDPFGVLVVDNGSSDGSADLVERHYPAVRLVRSERNLGYAAGNNLGLRQAGGDVIVLLNQDTVVHPGWLAGLVETLASDPQRGIAGAKALYPDGTIQHAGGVLDERGEGSHLGRHQTDDGEFDRATEVDYVSGASLAISRRALQTIGDLDEGFTPAYYEDVDWCLRAREAGFAIVYAPASVLTHHETSTAATLGYSGAYLQHRHRLRCLLKHRSADDLAGCFLPAEEAWLLGLGEGAEELVAAAHHAYLDQMLCLCDLMTWRKRLHGSPDSEADVLAKILVTLRSVAPTGPARLGKRVGRAGAIQAGEELSPGAGAPPDPIQAHLLTELRRSFAVQIGESGRLRPAAQPIKRALQRALERRLFRWYAEPLIEQQNTFNALSTEVGELAFYKLERLAEVMAAYVAECGRELAELAREVQELRDLRSGVRSADPGDQPAAGDSTSTAPGVERRETPPAGDRIDGQDPAGHSPR